MMVCAGAVSAVLGSCGSTTASDVMLRHTLAAEREAFRNELISSVIEDALSRGPAQGEDSTWESAFWAMELASYTSPRTTDALGRGFRVFSSQGASFRRALLEVVYGLYPNAFLAEADSVSLTSEDEKLFAMSTLHALRGSRLSAGQARERMARRFPHPESHPILRMLAAQLDAAMGHAPGSPSLAELLAHPFPDGAPVVFSLQRSDMHYQGRAVVRTREGLFLRDSSGAYFSVPQLALSAANLPGYLTNGNTPQGVLSFQGYDVSANPFIGPTPNIQLVLPFEAPPAVFFHGGTGRDSAWRLEHYDSLLPPGWRGYIPLQEAYFAGQAGRTEIIAHGTTIDPEFYRGQPFYPTTPSLGCLTAPEEWSLATGHLVHSDQQRLIDTLRRVGFEGGYCVVVNIDDEPSPVSAEEIHSLLTAEEQRWPR